MTNAELQEMTLREAADRIEAAAAALGDSDWYRRDVFHLQALARTMRCAHLPGWAHSRDRLVAAAEALVGGMG